MSSDVGRQLSYNGKSTIAALTKLLEESPTSDEAYFEAGELAEILTSGVCCDRVQYHTDDRELMTAWNVMDHV